MRKQVILALSALLLLFVFTACSETEKTPEAADLTLVEGGVCEYRIVVAAEAAEPYRNAASELQKYMQLVTGQEIAVVTDAEAKTDKEILIGKTNRGDFGFDFETVEADAYKIFASGSSIEIAGGKRGCIYGAYAFLREAFGVKFYSFDCEVVPTVTDCVWKADTVVEATPFFKYRFTYGGLYDQNGIVQESDRMKFGMLPFTAAWGGADDVAANNFDMHTINYLLNNSENASLHTYNKQPCVSCDENYNKILATALEWIERREGKCTYINISQNDGPGGWCTCDLCTQYNDLYGNGLPTGSWWYFINRIAADIHKVYPDVEVRTYAYEDTAELTSLEIGPGIAAYVSTGNPSPCSNHGLTECEANAENGVADQVRTWGEKLDKFFVYEYYNSSGEHNMTFANLYAMRSNYRFFAENGAYGIIPFGTRRNAADLVVLRYYLYTRLLWDPYVSEEDYQGWIDEFCEVYYGKDSGRYISDFVRLFDETFKDKHIRIEYGFKVEDAYELAVIASSENYRLPSNGAELAENGDIDAILNVSNILESDYFNKAHALFDAALEKAEDETKRARIEKASLQVDYHEVYIYRDNAAKMKDYLTVFNEAFGTNVKKTEAMNHWYDMNTALAEALQRYECYAITESMDIEDKEINSGNLPRQWVWQ